MLSKGIIKASLLVLAVLFSFTLKAAEDKLDSLISTWNKMSEDFLKVREIDSACKYGNCAVDMLEQRIEKNISKLEKYRVAELQRQKADALSTLVTAYGTSGEIELAVECYTEAVDILKTYGLGDDLFQLYIRMGRVKDLRSNYKEAIPYYLMARDEALRIGNKEHEAITYYHIGLNNRYLGNYSEALRYHLMGLKINEEFGDTLGIASSYITVAAILRKLHDWESAIDRLNRAKTLFISIPDTGGIATVYNDLGATYYSIGDTALSLKNHMKAASLRQSANDFNGLGASNTYISRIYLDQGEYKKALDYLQKADEAFRKSSNDEGIMNVQIDIAEVYITKKDYRKAITWLDAARQTGTEIMNYVGLINVFMLRGDVYFLQQNYDDAIRNYQKGLRFAKQLKYNQKIYDINTRLAETFAKGTDFQNAFEHLSASVHYKDSVDMNADYAAAVQMEMQYNHEKEKIQREYEQNKRDTENQLKLTRQQNQNRLFLVGVFMFLLISVGLFSRLRYIRKSSRALKKQKELAEKQKQIAEYESRRATESEKVKQLFLANMSHEIRTPMNAIKGMTDILLRNEHPSSQDIYLNAIKKSSEALLVILNDILDLSKLDAGKLEMEKIEFQPLEVVRGIYNLLRFKAEEKGLKLNIKETDNIPEHLCGDPTRLHQILVNLANNAIKFTEKGSVTIEINNIKQTEQEVTLQFKVIDTGIGIVKDKISDMFELFTQADTDTTRKYGGTGLGLSICRRLVKMQNGEIYVDSETQVGSTFTVEIPYDLADVKGRSEHRESLDELKDIDLLLVEDNEFNVIVARDELEMSIPGVQIETAENGLVALEKIKQGDYDIVLMDIQMPEMDGWDTTRNIRKLAGDKAKIPVVAMTAFAMKTEIDKCFSAGMDAYVPKPFKREQLLRTLSECLHKSPVKKEKTNRQAPKQKTIKPAEKDDSKITSKRFLEEFCKGDQVKMQKYIGMYLKSTPGYLEKIQSAFENSDFAGLKIVVHAMKPHLNFMGMGKTRELAEDIEGVLLDYLDNNDEAEQVSSLNGKLQEKLDRFLKDCNKSLIELS